MQEHNFYLVQQTVTRTQLDIPAYLSYYKYYIHHFASTSRTSKYNVKNNNSVNKYFNYLMSVSKNINSKSTTYHVWLLPLQTLYNVKQLL